MKVPFLDLKAQYNSIKEEVNPAIQNILDNTAFILGKSVSEFETNFAKALDVKSCSAVSSGTTNDEKLGAKFKMMREHGSSQKYHHEMYGHNYRMEGIQGAVLNVKLKHLNDWTNERRRVAKKYKECLKGVDQIILPFEMDYAKHVYHLFVIQVKSKDKADRSATRNELQKFLEDNGVSTGLHYPIPLHVQPCFKSLGYKKGDFPVAEELAERGLSLPVYPELADNMIEYVSEKIKEFFK